MLLQPFPILEIMCVLLRCFSLNDFSFVITDKPELPKNCTNSAAPIKVPYEIFGVGVVIATSLAKTTFFKYIIWVSCVVSEPLRFICFICNFLTKMILSVYLWGCWITVRKCSMRKVFWLECYNLIKHLNGMVYGNLELGSRFEWLLIDILVSNLLLLLVICDLSADLLFGLLYAF